MKDANDYPVTFAYGATDGVFYGPNGSIGPYHRGDDRAMPVGTPVIVNGVEIGLSGSTGASSGPHLHIGRFVGGKDTNPGGLGFDLPSASVFDTGYDSTNGNYVRIASEGAIWVYLHLSKIEVTKGQVLGGNMTDAELKDLTGWKDWGVKVQKAMGASGVPADVINDPALLTPYLKDLIAWKKQGQDLAEQNKQLTAGLTTLKPGRYMVQ